MSWLDKLKFKLFNKPKYKKGQKILFTEARFYSGFTESLEETLTLNINPYLTVGNITKIVMSEKWDWMDEPVGSCNYEYRYNAYIKEGDSTTGFLMWSLSEGDFIPVPAQTLLNIR